MTTVAWLSAAAFFWAAPAAVAGALLKVDLPILPAGSPAQDVHVLVIGQIQGERFWLNDQWHDLKTGTALPDEELPPPNKSSPTVLDASGQPIPIAAGIDVIPTQFEMAGGDSSACEQSPRFRELSFLVNSLADTVEFVEVAGSYKTRACRSRVVAAFAATGLATRDTEAYASTSGGASSRGADAVIVRVFFRRAEAVATTATAVATGGSPATSAAHTGTTTVPPDPNSPTPAATPQAPASSDFVLVDGRAVKLTEDGWFAADIGSSRQVTVEVRNGRRVRLSLPANLFLLKAGLNTGYRNDRFQGIEFNPTAPLAISMLTGEDIDKLLGLELSVPLYLKVGIGYTLLTPLPTERERDRPTIAASLRTYPFWERYHIAGDIITSLRSGSKIPWTVLGTVYLGTDLTRIKNQFTVPVGVGLRLFQSKINQDVASAPSDKAIRIPEAVLGPAGKIGVHYKSGLIYSEAVISVTPLFVPGSKTSVTVNYDVAAGYQINELDTLVVNLVAHDLRYPTSDGEAKVIASSVLLGYQRDLY